MIKMRSYFFFSHCLLLLILLLMDTGCRRHVVWVELRLITFFISVRWHYWLLIWLLMGILLYLPFSFFFFSSDNNFLEVLNWVLGDIIYQGLDQWFAVIGFGIFPASKSLRWLVQTASKSACGIRYFNLTFSASTYSGRNSLLLRCSE